MVWCGVCLAPKVQNRAHHGVSDGTYYIAELPGAMTDADLRLKGPDNQHFIMIMDVLFRGPGPELPSEALASLQGHEHSEKVKEQTNKVLKDIQIWKARVDHERRKQEAQEVQEGEESEDPKRRKTKRWADLDMEVEEMPMDVVPSYDDLGAGHDHYPDGHGIENEEELTAPKKEVEELASRADQGDIGEEEIRERLRALHGKHGNVLKPEDFSEEGVASASSRGQDPNTKSESEVAKDETDEIADFMNEHGAAMEEWDAEARKKKHWQRLGGASRQKPLLRRGARILSHHRHQKECGTTSRPSLRKKPTTPLMKNQKTWMKDRWVDTNRNRNRDRDRNRKRNRKNE